MNNNLSLTTSKDLDTWYKTSCDLLLELYHEKKRKMQFHCKHDFKTLHSTFECIKICKICGIEYSFGE